MCAAIVLDIGSDTCKAGFAGRNSPEVLLPSVVSHVEGIHVGNRQAEGNHVPIEPSGYVTNWDDMNHIFVHLFDQQLHIKPEEHPILLTETLLGPKANRETLTELMIETYQFPAMYLAVQAALALFNTGSTTGVVLNFGAGTGQIVPIYDSFVIVHAISVANITVEHINQRLEEPITHRYGVLPKEIIRDIKHTQTYVALDYQQELAQNKSSSYILPDGRTITLGNERFQCVETLFQDSVRDVGLHEVLLGSIRRCHEDIHEGLLQNIVFSGGSTLYPGMVERTFHELSALVPQSKIGISAPGDGLLSVWRGASKYASNPDFLNKCVSKDEYLEYGPSLIHRKCNWSLN
jgi:actin-related protein